MKHRMLTKTALILSFVLFALWWMLGTTATLAWFEDTSPEVKNQFYFGELKLKVSFKKDNMSGYAPLDAATEVFDRSALYEPGYTQVIYLKIENVGDVDFDYKLSVTVDKDIEHTRTALNMYGQDIYLPNYLRYGVLFAPSEPELTRLVAQELADEYNLDTWSKRSEKPLSVGDEPCYAALIVYMPEEVGNEANYRDDHAPSVGLGITILAQQEGTMTN